MKEKRFAEIAQDLQTTEKQLARLLKSNVNG